MKAVLQRAAEASIIIDGVDGGAIGPGLVLLLGVMQGDTEAVSYTHLDVYKRQVYLGGNVPGLHRLFWYDGPH